MVAPGSWLHGASVRGSAAAPVSEPTVPVLIAPARTTPRPSSIRRSSRPLAATVFTSEDRVASRRRSELLMFPPCLPFSGFVAAQMEFIFRSPPAFPRVGERLCAPPGLAGKEVRVFPVIRRNALRFSVGARFPAVPPPRRPVQLPARDVWRGLG